MTFFLVCCFRTIAKRHNIIRTQNNAIHSREISLVKWRSVTFFIHLCANSTPGLISVTGPAFHRARLAVFPVLAFHAKLTIVRL